MKQVCIKETYQQIDMFEEDAYGNLKVKDESKQPIQLEMDLEF